MPRTCAEAERGHDVVVVRDGRPVAAVISVGKLERLVEWEADLRVATLVLTRAVNDHGSRHDLDTVVSSLGFDRAELETGFEAELVADRE